MGIFEDLAARTAANQAEIDQQRTGASRLSDEMMKHVINMCAAREQSEETTYVAAGFSLAGSISGVLDDREQAAGLIMSLLFSRVQELFSQHGDGTALTFVRKLKAGEIEGIIEGDDPLEDLLHE